MFDTLPLFVDNASMAHCPGGAYVEIGEAGDYKPSVNTRLYRLNVYLV